MPEFAIYRFYGINKVYHERHVKKLPDTLRYFMGKEKRRFQANCFTFKDSHVFTSS